MRRRVRVPAGGSLVAAKQPLFHWIDHQSTPITRTHDLPGTHTSTHHGVRATLEQSLLMLTQGEAKERRKRPRRQSAPPEVQTDPPGWWMQAARMRFMSSVEVLGLRAFCSTRAFLSLCPTDASKSESQCDSTLSLSHVGWGMAADIGWGYAKSWVLLA